MDASEQRPDPGSGADTRCHAFAHVMHLQASRPVLCTIARALLCAQSPFSDPLQLHPLQPPQPRFPASAILPAGALILQRPLAFAEGALGLARAPPPPALPGFPTRPAAGGCPPDPTSDSSSGTGPCSGLLSLTNLKAALPAATSAEPKAAAATVQAERYGKVRFRRFHGDRPQPDRTSGSCQRLSQNCKAGMAEAP